MQRKAANANGVIFVDTLTMPQPPASRPSELRLFGSIDAPIASALATKGCVRIYKEQKVLYRRGDEPKKIYMVLDGIVVLDVTGRNGQTEVVDYCGVGEWLNLESACDNGPHLVTATSSKPAALLEISVCTFRRSLSRDPALLQCVNVMLADRLRKARERLCQFKYHSVSQRLAKYLLDIVYESQSSRIVIPVEKRLLAARLGTSAESLSRALACLRKLGVSTSGSVVDIADVSKLQQMVYASQ